MSRPPRDFREWMRMMEREVAKARAAGNTVLVNRLQRDIDTIQETIKDGGGDTRTPARVIEVVAQTSIYADDNGVNHARLVVDFPPVTLATNGTSVLIDNYELWGRDETNWDGEGDGPAWRLIDTSNVPNHSVYGFREGSYWRFRVRAMGRTTINPGEWSSEFAVEMEEDTTPPPIPTNPEVEVWLSVFRVRWDGLAAGGVDWPADLLHIEVGMGSTEEPDTIIGPPLEHAGQVVVPGVPYNETRWFRLRSVDSSGNKSAWSGAVAAQSQPLVDTDLIHTTIDDRFAAEADARVELDGRLADAETDLGEATATLTDLRDVRLPALREDLDAAGAWIDETGTGLAGRLDTAESDLEAARGRLSTAEQDILDAFGDISDVSGVASGAASTASAAQAAADQAAARAEKAIRSASNLAPVGNMEFDGLYPDLLRSQHSQSEWQVVYDPDDAYQGSRFLRYTHRDAHAGWAILTDEPQVIEGRTYRISLAFRIVEGRFVTSNGGVAPMWWSTEGNSVNLSAYYPNELWLGQNMLANATDEWQVFTGLVTPPPGYNVDRLRLRLYFNQTALADGTVVDIDALTVLDVTDALEAMQAAEEARQAAADAHAAAGAAQDTADAAVASANGKNAVYRSINEPRGEASEGDWWWQYTDRDYSTVIGRWTWGESTGWVKNKDSHQVIDSVDVGTLTVAGESRLPEVVSRHIASEAGQFVELDVEQLRVSGTSTVDTQVAESIWAAKVAARKIMAHEVIIGGATNLIVDPNHRDASLNTLRVAGSGENWFLVAWSDGQRGWRNRNTSDSIDNQIIQLSTVTETEPEGGFPVDEGDTLLASISLQKQDGRASLFQVWMRLRVVHADGTRTWQSIRLANPDGSLTVDETGWRTMSGTIRIERNSDNVPPVAAIPSILLRGGDGEGWIWVRNPYIAVQADAHLIVDGAVQARHVDAESVAAAVGQFVELDVEQLRVTGTSTVDTQVAESIWAAKVAARKVLANEVLIGRNANLIPWHMDTDEGADETERWFRSYGSSTETPRWQRPSSDGDVGRHLYLDAYWQEGTTLTWNIAPPDSSGWPVSEGESYVFRFRARLGGSWSGRPYPDVAASIYFYDANGGNLSYSTGSWVRINWNWSEPILTVNEAPAGAAYMRAYIRQNQPGGVRVTDVSLEKQVDHALIVDGSILARHVGVGEIDAGHIDVNSLVGDTGWIGSLRTGILTSDVVVSEMIHATQGITSKHTITGATIRTSSSGRRVQLDSIFGIRGWNSSGQITFAQNTSTGDFDIAGIVRMSNSVGTLRFGNNLMSSGTPAIRFDRAGSSYRYEAGLQLRTAGEHLLVQAPTRTQDTAGARLELATNGVARLMAAASGNNYNPRLQISYDGGIYLGTSGATQNHPVVQLNTDGSFRIGAQASSSYPAFWVQSDASWRIGRSDRAYMRGFGNAITFMSPSGQDLGVQVNGWFDANSKAFNIPHPLDPERRLIHGVTESPAYGVEYNGTVTLDEDGVADVALPDYFEALTRPDNRSIQLTGVGRGEVWIEEEIFDGTFVVGGQPGQRVHWRVFAERADVWVDPEPLISDLVQPPGEVAEDAPAEEVMA